MNNNFNEEAFIKRVEDAAREGAREGARKGSKGGSAVGGAAARAGMTVLSKILILVIIIMAVQMYVPKLNPFNYIRGWFNKGDVEGHDLTWENHGFFGFKAVDFQDAILGMAESQKKLEVYTREVSDIATITDAGLGGWAVFTKNQVLTYHGTAIYTVDLAQLSKDSIEYDKGTGVVTMYIPRPELGTLDIPAECIEFGEVEKGTFAFGKLEATPEETAKAQAAAEDKMCEKLESENVIADAEQMAISNVWSLYQPIVSNVGSGVKLEVKFADEA